MGAENFPHAASADLLDDAIVTQRLANKRVLKDRLARLTKTIDVDHAFCEYLMRLTTTYLSTLRTVGHGKSSDAGLTTIGNAKHRMGGVPNGDGRNGLWDSIKPWRPSAVPKVAGYEANRKLTSIGVPTLSEQ